MSPVQPLISEPEADPPLPLFALLETPYGTCNAALGLVPMYLLRRGGYTITESAAIVSIVSLPSTFYFLYAPLTDFLVSRRTWYLLALGVSTLLGVATVLNSAARQPGLITGLLFAYCVGQTLIGASTGGLMSALLSVGGKARVGAWVQLGNQGVATVGFGLLVYLSTWCRVSTLALVTVAMMLPGLAVFWLPLPVRHTPPEPFSETLRGFGRELRDILWSWRTLPGFLLLLSPLSAAALTTVLTGLSEEYHATAAQLAFANGWGGGAFVVLGSMSLLALPARWNSLARYVLAGIVNGVVSGLVAFGPLTSTTFIVGMLASNFAVGVCYAACTGLVLSLAGHACRRQGTRYALFNSLANLSSTYMVALEGYSAGHYGTRYASGIDGLGSLLTAALVGVVYLGWRARRQRRPEASRLLADNT